MKRAALLTCLLLAAASRPVRASEISEALTARGLVEMHDEHLPAAIALFDQAVAADPEDPVAYYQRGVAYAKEGDFAQAIENQQKALALRPDLDEAALELGVALVELGRTEEARPWLTQAQRRPELEGQAAFFLGIADLRDGRLDEARSEFERARVKDPTVEVSSRYYLGVVEYRAGAKDAASEHFLYVEQMSPQSAVGRESSAFLELIRNGQGTYTHVYGSLSTQYDTNVVLAPAQGLPPPNSISNTADGRVTITAGGVWVPWHNDRARLSIGYDFYQDLQFRLHSFNIQDNRPTVQFTYDFGPVHSGVLGSYDFFLLETSSFLSQVSLLPWVVIPEKIGRTELYMRYQYRDYLDDTFFQLTGNDYAGGVRQVFNLGEDGREVWVGYQADTLATTKSEIYAYDANQVETSLLWPLGWQTTMQVGYRFRSELYNDASAFFAPIDVGARVDHEHRAGVAFRKDLNEFLSLVASWVGTFNLSNKDEFQYTRQIGSLGVEVRY